VADLSKKFISQLDAAIDAYGELLQKSNYEDLSDLSHADHQRVISMCRAAVERASGTNSPYARQVTELLRKSTSEGIRVAMVAGVAQSLRADLAAGHLRTATELIHAAMLGDLLEMADTLLAAGRKDAAAVVGGSSLEAHLRRLCVKSGVATEARSGSRSQANDALQLNSDLGFAYAIEPLDQKNVAVWLEIHQAGIEGRCASVSDQKIALQIQGIRDFITRNPA
jgi:hypothetical protein